MKSLASIVIGIAILSLTAPATSQTIWLDDIDLSAMDIGWGSPHSRRSVEGNPLSIAGKTFERGVGTHAVSTLLLKLDGKAERFMAHVGVDDETQSPKASVVFTVLGDKKILWKSGLMRTGDQARSIDLDLSSIRLLGLLVEGTDDGIDYDHADWCDARIVLNEPLTREEIVLKYPSDPYILTPPVKSTPRVNGPSIFGVRPRHPVLYTVAASGDRPMVFSADRLPTGLIIDSLSGQVTGSVEVPDTYRVTFRARNSWGQNEKVVRIVVGPEIALTPPMGWNSWNCWACAVDDSRVRASADAMVSSGLANHGWSYVNVDDCWEIKPDSDDELLSGPPRDSLGMINTNRRFPDMGALSEYVHSRGLKFGIYSGPGPLTCAGFTASYGYERQDARRYSEWGIDYLKYDWCSYGSIAKDRSVPELAKPYEIMRDALKSVSRDIVYSLCQYGMGNVWEWGRAAGGNCWRTTGDIVDTWASMSRIGFGQAGLEQFAGPGHWNDPDMLVVGKVGWGPELRSTRLTPDEQYTHISLWSLLAAPLLLGCDLTNLDPFTLNLLTNDEVIDVNQDALGRQASKIMDEDGLQMWTKMMEDGSTAVGIFFVGTADHSDPAEYFDWEFKTKINVVFRPEMIGMKGNVRVRDLWRQEDLSNDSTAWELSVPRHGVRLLRIWQR